MEDLEGTDKENVLAVTGYTLNYFDDFWNDTSDIENNTKSYSLHTVRKTP